MRQRPECAGNAVAVRRRRQRGSTPPPGGCEEEPALPEEVPGSGREGPLAGGLAASDGWCNAPPIFSFSAAQKKRKRAVHGPKEKKMRGTARLGQRTGRISARGRESTGGGRLRKGLSSWPRLRAAAAETYLRFAFQESRCLLKTAKRSVCRFYRRQTLLLFQMPSQRQRGQEVKSFPRLPNPLPAPIAWAACRSSPQVPAAPL